MSQLPPAARPAPGESKLQQVRRLVDVLELDLKEHNLLPAQRAATLEQLKVFGRDPNQSDPIFTKEGIQILCRHGFDESDETSSREALRCLANALLITPKTRQSFIDLGYAQKAAAKFKSDSLDDEFLLARILFVITYDTEMDLRSLVEEHQLDQHINHAIERHAATYSDDQKAKEPAAMQDMALNETLKLLFNISHFLKEKSDLYVCSESIPNLFKILRLRSLPTPPLQPPVSLLINALLNQDLASHKEDAFPESDPACNVTRLLKILDMSLDKKFTKLNGDPATHFDEVGAPLVTLLRKLLEIAPEGVKGVMRDRLLPSEEDREQPLGRGYSLASRMLQISTSATTPKTRENTMQLLFELSESDAETFVHNIGYGYASGFLMTRNIPFSPKHQESNGSSSGPSKPVNPITGQKLENEPQVPDPFAGMSDAEKEREAERLFVLFERLKKTGVVDVKNPVELAKEEGRFEELDDDDSE